jgi:hypothetical protein
MAQICMKNNGTQNMCYGAAVAQCKKTGTYVGPYTGKAFKLPSNAVNSQQEAVLGWRPLFRLEPTYADRMSHLQKITFVEMREMGAHDVLIYCRDHRYSHHVETTADGWSDDVRLSDIESKFTCSACGKRRAEIRPKFGSARMGTS